MTICKIFDTLRARFLNFSSKKHNSPEQNQKITITGHNNTINYFSVGGSLKGEPEMHAGDTRAPDNRDCSDSTGDGAKEKKQSSKLQFLMLGANIFIPDESSHGILTGLAIDVRIWKTGIPTTITNWSLTVSPEGMPSTPAQLTQIPKKLDLKGTPNIVIQTSDELDSKIEATPLNGKLLFYVKLAQNIVLAPNTKLELIATDVNGIKTRKLQRIGDVWGIEQ